jgi:multidrug efflux pump subunit AcrA (membrane-fusion protein)
MRGTALRDPRGRSRVGDRRCAARRLAVLALAALAAGCGARATEEEQGPSPVVPVHIAQVTARRFEDVVRASGAWKSAAELPVAAPFAGVVSGLGVHAGDVVRAGASVGTLESQESHAALEGARLMVRTARDAAARDEARRALRLAERERVQVPLVAPQAGVVLRRSAEPGSQVAAGAEVVAIVPWASVVFQAHVPGGQNARVRPGQRAVIEEEGRPARDAVVQRTLPAADPADQSTLVWLVPERAAPAPQLERFGTAVITVGVPRVLPGVPDSAVVQDDLTGADRIAVVDPSSRAHWTVVTLGPGSGGWHALVAPSLAPGTRVIVEGQRGLPDSTQVRPLP